MLGLNYDSSDEEEEENGSNVAEAQKFDAHSHEKPNHVTGSFRIDGLVNTKANGTAGDVTAGKAKTDDAAVPKEPLTMVDRIVETIGPLAGPEPSPSKTKVDPTDAISESRLSPFTSARQSIQNLTMPPIPNFDIPPSPPGSPPAQATKKFDNFLMLKAQGVHFNEKLANSSQLRNPNLFEKLCDFAGIDDREQYANALSLDLLTPAVFPPWAYGEQLNKKQADLQRKKDEARKGRLGVEFVSASGSASGSRSSTPGRTSRVSKLSTAEKIMAGQSPGVMKTSVERKRPRSPDR